VEDATDKWEMQTVVSVCIYMQMHISLRHAEVMLLLRAGSRSVQGHWRHSRLVTRPVLTAARSKRAILADIGWVDDLNTVFVTQTDAIWSTS
jgi:hypothetical protein